MIWRSLLELPVWLRVFTLGRLIKSAGSLAWLYLAVYLVGERGLSPAHAGLIIGAHGIGTIAGTVSGGWIGDHLGIRRTMIVANLGSAAASLLVPVAPVSLLGIVFVLGGFIGAWNFPLGMALVTGSLPESQRRAGAALARAAMNAGVVIGPPLGALAAAYSFGLIFVIEAVAGLAMALLIWRLAPTPARPVAIPPLRWKALLADRPMWTLLLAVMLVDAAYRQIFTGLPLMLTGSGTPLIGFGLLVSASSVLIVLAETPLAIRLKGHAALRIIPLGYAFIALGFVVLSVWPAYGGAVLAIGVITIGEMLYKPTSAAFAADRAPDGMHGRYQALYMSASITGSVVSPPIGGALYQYAPSVLWPLCAVLAALGALLLYSVSRRTTLTPQPIHRPATAHPNAVPLRTFADLPMAGPDGGRGARVSGLDDRIPRQYRRRHAGDTFGVTRRGVSRES